MGLSTKEALSREYLVGRVVSFTLQAIHTLVASERGATTDMGSLLGRTAISIVGITKTDCEMAME